MTLFLYRHSVDYGFEYYFHIQSKQDDSTLEITNSISHESAKQTVDYYCPTCIQEIGYSDSIECSKCNMVSLLDDTLVPPVVMVYAYHF
jgi:hypothetical protein